MTGQKEGIRAAGPETHDWRIFGAVFALFLIGAVLRFIYLGKESVWLDEVLSLEFARGSLAEIIHRTAADVHPPLYYLILHPFLWLGTREEILRFPSFLFGALAIPGIYLLGRELWGRERGLVAALLLAFSPFHLFYSQEARMYPLFFFWVVLSTYLLVLALKRGEPRFWILYSVTAALSLYTHYFTLFVLLAQNVYLFFHALREGFRRDFLLRWVSSQALILLLFSPWLPVLFAQYQSGKGDWIIRYFGYPGVKSVIETIRVFGTGPPQIGKLFEILSFLFLGLAVLGLGRPVPIPDLSPRLFLGLAFFLPLTVVFLASLFKPAYQVKYLIGLYPFYLLLVAGGVFFPRRKWQRILLVAVLLSSFAFPLYLHYRVIRGTTWREASKLVALNCREGDVVGFNAGYVSRIFSYYVQLNFPGQPIETYRFPYFKEGEKDRGKLEAEMTELARKYRRIWYFENHVWDSDPERIVIRYLRQNHRIFAESRGDPELYLFGLN